MLGLVRRFPVTGILLEQHAVTPMLLLQVSVLVRGPFELLLVIDCLLVVDHGQPPLEPVHDRLQEVGGSLVVAVDRQFFSALYLAMHAGDVGLTDATIIGRL